MVQGSTETNLFGERGVLVAKILGFPITSPYYRSKVARLKRKKKLDSKI